MGRIRILSDDIANKIAAGEVVERPASVAKELLENSLDAGATVVRVEAEHGGSRLLRITDNGHGMGRDDAMLAFERHATSKLRAADDLAAIATLGFRGEALPSIAAVCRLTLITREQQSDTGTQVEINGGKLTKCEDIAAPVGTSITVADLFYNMPARKKFLRSEQTEIAHIGGLLTHYSLAHPDKSFELRHAGRILLDVSPVNTLQERLYQVFGGQTLEDLIDLGENQRELLVTPPAPPPWRRTEEAPQPVLKQFHLRGFVSAPHVQKPNRNAIYLFVNGRLIRDKLLLHALSKAYHNLIPPDSFPFAAIFLDCEPDEVDVNVHPAKTEVRFHHRNFVHDFLEDTVRDRLMALRPAAQAPQPQALGAMWTGDATGNDVEQTAPSPSAGSAQGNVDEVGQMASHLPYSEYSQRDLDALEASSVDLSRLEAEGSDGPMGTSPGNLASGRTTAPAFGGFGLGSGRGFGTGRGSAAPASSFSASPFGLRPSPAPAPRLPFPGSVPPPHDADAPLLNAAPLQGDESAVARAAYAQLRSEELPNLQALRHLRPIGQWKNSFIVAVGEDGIWLIDQHIAHERILFEKILDGFARGKVESQHLLLPIVLEISAAAQLDYAAIEKELRAMGFETEPFGVRTLAVNAAPADLPQGEIEAMIREVLEAPDADWRSRSPEDLRRELAASMSCKAAIKINMPLDITRMEWLLRTLAETRYPMTCPHGRPIALRYGANDILKAFHRL